PRAASDPPAPAVAAAAEDAIARAAVAAGAAPPHTRSLARRMMVIAAGWIFVPLLVGGVALDRTLKSLVERQFDEQLEQSLTAMIASAEIDPYGEVMFNRSPADQRFLEPNSGLYWQISGEGYEDWPSRSLWDRTLQISGKLARS